MNDRLSLILYLVAALAWAEGCKEPKTAFPEERPLVEAVYASGSVEADDAYAARSQAAGELVELAVQAGDSVAVGQLLARVRNENPKIQLADAKARLALARRNMQAGGPVLSELRESIASAEARLRLDSTNFARYQRLFAKGAAARNQLDEAELQYETARNQLAQAKDRYQSARIELETQYEQALYQVDLAKERKSDYAITSRRNGLVLDLYAEAGEVVAPGRELMTIGNPATYKLELLVDEEDVNRLRKGQQVLIQLDNYPDTTFEGNIARIYPALDEANRSFRVDAVFNRKPEKLFAGLSAEVNIVVAEKNKTLVIPREYLLPGDSARVLNADGQPETRAVRVGLSNLEYVEILGGLTKETPLLAPEE